MESLKISRLLDRSEKLINIEENEKLYQVKKKY
jgi:hypothetical protein